MAGGVGVRHMTWLACVRTSAMGVGIVSVLWTACATLFAGIEDEHVPAIVVGLVGVTLGVGTFLWWIQ